MFSGTLRLLAVFTSFILVACQSTTMPVLDDSIPLPTHVAGASDAGIIQMEKRMQASGVQVVTMGQDYLISVPAPLLFESESPQLTWESYRVLNEIACYLQQFRKVSITISAFTCQYVSPAREQALTLARAKAVSHYLWSQGVDSRFMFTRGLGRNKPIGAVRVCGENSPNARVELTFRRVVA